MHSDLAEVLSEARLHKFPGAEVKRLTRRTKHLMNDRRHFNIMVAGASWFAPQRLFLFCACATFLAGRVGAAIAFALQRLTRHRRLGRGYELAFSLEVHR